MQTLTTPCKHEHHQIGAYAKAGKADPTHTTVLRNAFAREMKRRYLTFARAIKTAVDERDCFGLKSTHILTMAGITPPGELAFAFPRTSQKVAAFMDWIQAQNKLFLEAKGVWTEGIELITAPQLGIGVEDVWTNKYIHSAYQKGIFRARQEMKKAGYNVPSIGESGGLGVALNQPMHIDRLGLVYSRTYEELKGINSAMSSQISRVLAQGMAEGRNPRELAVLLASTVMGPVGGLGITDTLGRFIPAARRAEIMARTEIIRAHHVATIQEYRNWGLEGVQVQAEWATAGDDRVCDECASLEGKIFTLEEIESMIPRHPQCRCIALPIEEKDVVEKGEEEGEEEASQKLSPIKERRQQISKRFNLMDIGQFGFELSDIEELQSINAVGKELQRLSSKYPKITTLTNASAENIALGMSGRKLLVSFALSEFENPGSFGIYIAKTNTMHVRPIAVTNAVAKIAPPNSWTSVLDDVFGSFRHEYAHAIHHHLPDEKFRSWFYDIYKTRDKLFWKNTVSEYGSTSANELFAEAFVKYTSPAYEQGMLPENIEQFFKELMG